MSEGRRHGTGAGGARRTRVTRLANAVIAFNGLTMNGGFLDSFSSCEDPLADIAEGFELFGLPRAAGLVREGMALLPAGGAHDGSLRSDEVDGLTEEAAARLEQLGEDYGSQGIDAELEGRISAYWHEHPAEAPPEAPLGRIEGGIEEMLAEYLDTLVRWDTLGSRSPGRANAHLRRAQELYRQLRTSPAGRAGIDAVMEDPREGVRLAAAVHNLAWAPDRAASVLDELAHGRGMISFDAKVTLDEYRAGRLNLDR